MPASLKETDVLYLATTRIGEKGQITVPKEFREDLGLGAGSAFAVLRLGSGLILVPEQKRFDELCERVRSALTHAGVKPSELLKTLPRARKRVFVEHYGVSPSRKQVGRRRRNHSAH